jgi:hypothetical protein
LSWCLSGIVEPGCELYTGLILAPKTFVDSSIHAVAYLPSMALGAPISYADRSFCEWDQSQLTNCTNWLAILAAAIHVSNVTAGVAVVAPVLTIIVGMLGGARRLPPKASMQTGAKWGIAAGIIWNLGAADNAQSYCLTWARLTTPSSSSHCRRTWMQVTSFQSSQLNASEWLWLTRCSSADCWWLARGAF